LLLLVPFLAADLDGGRPRLDLVDPSGAWLGKVEFVGAGDYGDDPQAFGGEGIRGL
jgi:hypothetical protein